MGPKCFAAAQPRANDPAGLIPAQYGSAMTGKKYPPPVATVAGSRFMYAEQGIQAPFFFPRWLFLHLGQYPLDFSCPGLPGVGFDMEMGYRMWSSNLTVGLYEPHFQHRVDKLGGTKSNPVQLKARNEATWVNLRIIEQAYRAQGVCLYNRLCKKGSDSVFVRKINALNKKLRGDKGQGGHPNPSASHRKHRRPNESAEDMISTFGDDRDEVADTLPSWAAGHTAYITQVLAGVTLGLAAIEGLLTVSVGKSLFVKLRRRSQRHIKR